MSIFPAILYSSIRAVNVRGVRIKYNENFFNFASSESANVNFFFFYNYIGKTHTLMNEMLCN